MRFSNEEILATMFADESAVSHKSVSGLVDDLRMQLRTLRWALVGAAVDGLSLEEMIDLVGETVLGDKSSYSAQELSEESCICFDLGEKAGRLLNQDALWNAGDMIATKLKSGIYDIPRWIMLAYQSEVVMLENGDDFSEQFYRSVEPVEE